jgi:hypothetical protein
MSVIDLGEPGLYEPGEPPILRGYASLSRRQRRRLYAVAALVVLAGALGGVAPHAEADPQVHSVGRVRGPLTRVLGDTVITYSEQSGEIVAYPLNGEGPRWTVPTDQPPLTIETVGDLFVISFMGLSYLESTINSQRELPARVVAVEAATGRPRWQVGGYPVSPLDAPVVAIGTGTEEEPFQTLVGVDVRDGKQLWENHITGIPLIRDERDGVRLRNDEIVIVNRNGSVFLMTLADGTTRASGHVLPGAEGRFEWRGLLGVRQAATQPNTQDTFLLYRLGEDRPLWQMKLPAGSPELSPCGDQLCMYDSSGLRRFNAQTGEVEAVLGTDDPDEFNGDPWRAWYPGLSTSHWEPIDMYKGQALVRLDPSFTTDTRTWLGVATLDGAAVSVRPLMRIGGRSNYCMVTENWLFCDGSTVEDAVAVRLSELDRLLGV